MGKKHTIEYIRDEFAKENCKLLSTEYINAKEKLHYYATCTCENWINWNDFQQGKGRICKKCSKIEQNNSSKLTYKYVKEEFAKFGCNLISDSYENNRTPLKYYAQCGCIHEITFANFQSGKGRLCRNCQIDDRTSKRRLKYEDVKNKFEESGCKLLSTEYKNNRTKLYYEATCGCNNWITFDSFQQGQGRKCRSCIFEDNKKTHEQFIEDVYKLVGNEYAVLGKYDGGNTKLLMKHNECGFEWEIRAGNFTNNNQRCPQCAIEKKTKTHEQFLKEVYDLVGDEYEVVGKYEKSYKKISILHKECNREHNMKPRDFLGGVRCPYCSKSKGEQKVANWLEENNIKYIDEYDKFEDLVGINGGLLRFDFVVFNEDDSIKCIIEYDGYFHYHKVYKDDGHEYTVEHDKRKNNYCKDNNIWLIRIPYWELDNIESILDRELINNNK